MIYKCFHVHTYMYTYIYIYMRACIPDIVLT